MKPFFLESTAGNIFGLYHAPAMDEELKGNILFVPPFAEELNRSRHMINRQARRFCAAGYGVLILDLFGTGDSEGTFGEATVDIWQKDILGALAWLTDTSDSPVTLWAMRSGALIAADLVHNHPHVSDQMILWSPVSNGKKFISQYMRIKQAAEMTIGTPKLTIKDLWTRLDAGDSLEIAGYTLSPELAYGFSALSLNNILLPQTLSVKWLEISLSDPANLPPASRKIIDTWRENKIDVSAKAVKDVSFWALQEPEWADSYIDQTMVMIEH